MLHYLGEQLTKRQEQYVHSALFYSLRANIAYDLAIRFMDKIITKYNKIVPFVKIYNTWDWTKKNKTLYVLRKTQVTNEKPDQNSQEFYIEDFSSFFDIQILGAVLVIYLAHRHFNLVRSPVSIQSIQPTKHQHHCEVDIKNIHHVIFEVLNSYLYYDLRSLTIEDNVIAEHQVGGISVEVYKHSPYSGARKLIIEYTTDYEDENNNKIVTINKKMNTFYWPLFNNCALGKIYTSVMQSYMQGYIYYTNEIKVIKEYVEAILFIINISSFRQLCFVLRYFASGFKTA